MPGLPGGYGSPAPHGRLTGRLMNRDMRSGFKPRVAHTGTAKVIKMQFHRCSQAG